MTRSRILALLLCFAGSLCVLSACAPQPASYSRTVPILLVFRKTKTPEGPCEFRKMLFDPQSGEVDLVKDRSQTVTAKAPGAFYQWDGRGIIRNPVGKKCASYEGGTTMVAAAGDETLLTISVEAGSKSRRVNVKLSEAGFEALPPITPLLISKEGDGLMVLTQYFRRSPRNPRGMVCGLCLTRVNGDSVTTVEIDMNDECCVSFNRPAVRIGEEVFLCIHEGIGRLSLESLRLERVRQFEVLRTKAVESILLRDPSQLDLITSRPASIGFWRNLLLIEWGPDDRQFIWGLDIKTLTTAMELTIQNGSVAGAKKPLALPQGYDLIRVVMPNRSPVSP